MPRTPYAVTESLNALPAFLTTLLLGIAVTVPAYGSLLRRLEVEDPAEFERLGRPTLFNRSPSKSLALQRFIYARSRSQAISPGLARLCRFLAVFTPLYVAAVLCTVGWLVATSLRTTA
jgi:hypothetical protein